MALILKDRVKVTTATTGTGTITLGSAVAGFQDFSVIGDGNETYYTINDAAGGDWEVGIGTYDSTGGTLSRDVVLESSNSGSLVDFAAGDKVVFVTYPADKSSVSFRDVVTANYTAGPSEGVIADTTGGAFTVTLPASPIAGTQVVITDGGGAFGSNNLTVGRNGSTIAGVADDLLLDINDVSVQFVYDGTTWKVYIQAGAAGATAVRQTFTATAGQTTFTVTNGYSVGFIDVYLNGVKLVNGVDVTVTSGTDVVLATGAALNDIIDVVGTTAFDLANALPLSGGTMTGDIVFTGTQTFVASQVTGLAAVATSGAAADVSGLAAVATSGDYADLSNTPTLPAFPTGAIVGDTDTQTLTNKTLTSPVLDGAPDVNGSVRGNIVAVSALDIDCAEGNYFTKTISANSTFTFSNAPASRAFAFTLELTHTSGTVTWPTEVKWPGDSAPTLATGKTHVFVFVTDDGGTRWRGVANVDYVN